MCSKNTEIEAVFTQKETNIHYEIDLGSYIIVVILVK